MSNFNIEHIFINSIHQAVIKSRISVLDNHSKMVASNMKTEKQAEANRKDYESQIAIYNSRIAK